MQSLPVLCYDTSIEGRIALETLNRSGIPFHEWDANVSPSDVGVPPFLSYGHKIYMGLSAIVIFIQSYPALKRAERVLRVHESKR